MARALTIRGSLHRLVDPLWIGLAAAVIGWGLAQTSYWHQVELKLLDFLVVRSAPNKVELPITIIGIDEATYTELKASWPLPRRHHARLLDNLKEAGAAVVGFDIVFPDASDARDDRPFADAIRRFRNVVLASDLSFREDAAVRQWFRVDPLPAFLEAGAQQGYVSMQVDGDAVLRRVPTERDAFWRAMLQRFAATHPGVIASLDAGEDMRIRYLGGPHTFTYIPYYQMLDPDRHLPPKWREFLHDNIVLVGRNLNVIGDVGAAQAEMYQTPFYYKTREFMPRAEVHANLIANMVAGEVLREAPRAWVAGAWLAAVLAGVLLMRRWHPLRSGIVLLVMALLLAGIQYGVYQRWLLWFPAAGAIMTVALIYASQGAAAFISEQRQRREIKDAFSMYVSPAVVEEMIAHPERLKLGGERRELTLLFSDLAGFTTISEQLEPEKVASLVNRHLSAMTEVILDHAGTVEKFVGDGIMAFWGAPVADARQSENAVRAAVKMQQRWEAMRPELMEQIGKHPGMRIGVNRGPCIVGNMGGYNRFDYTAAGDAVNLAARLEGVNKIYGTPILVSGGTIAAIDGALRFREVDTVRVKGKNVGIAVYTPCDDEALLALSAEALAAYREGRFEAAEQAWKRLLDRHPDDPVAMVFLERIAKLGTAGAPAGWDGITTLDSK